MNQTIGYNRHHQKDSTRKEGYISNETKLFGSEWFDSTHGSNDVVSIIYAIAMLYDILPCYYTDNE